MSGLVPIAASATTGIWFLPILMGALSYYQYDRKDPEGRPKDTKVIYKYYDFIVIGGGSAGSVVANRLSEVDDWNVLLLEAGGDETETSDVPALAAFLQGSELDWQYKTEPQSTACLGMVDKRCNWPRGKVLGGSSVLNYMLYVRGNRRDYDSWAASGNYGWSYEEILPYFIKSEDNRNPYLSETPYHGTGGYLTVQEAPYKTPLATAFVQGGVEMGYENRDGNGAYQTGFMIPQGTIRRGSRCSTAKAFLRPVRKRKNLHISMHSHVLQILIDPISKQASAVKFERKGKIYIIKATKEIILSGGSVNSPQILMLSGVGPAEHLNHLGIPVISDLRVGDNLQDHIAAGGMVFTLKESVSLVQRRFENLPSILRYAMFDSGPLTTLGGVEGLAWVNTKYANKSDDWPDIEFHFLSGNPASDGGVQIKQAHGLSDYVWDNYYEQVSYQDSWSVIPMLLRPKSAGYIRLKSTDPYDSPLIYPNYFYDEQDLRVLVEGVKIALALGETEAFKKFGSKFYTQPFPGCQHLPLWTDTYWGCFVRHYSATIYHPSGTCKMGPIWDRTAVVDPQLRVYGVSRLRVIDVSISPNIVSGNTNAPAIMIAEKGADMIKDYWLQYHAKK